MLNTSFQKKICSSKTYLEIIFTNFGPKFFPKGQLKLFRGPLKSPKTFLWRNTALRRLSHLSEKMVDAFWRLCRFDDGQRFPHWVVLFENPNDFLTWENKETDGYFLIVSNEFQILFLFIDFSISSIDFSISSTNFRTVELVCNDHGYNKFSFITNNILLSFWFPKHMYSWLYSESLNKIFASPQKFFMNKFDCTAYPSKIFKKTKNININSYKKISQCVCKIFTYETFKLRKLKIIFLQFYNSSPSSGRLLGIFLGKKSLKKYLLVIADKRASEKKSEKKEII